MIIANTIYDTVFKRLTAYETVAKFIVNVLLSTQVTSVEVKSQNITYTEDELTQAVSLHLFRLDFVAAVQVGENKYTKVLIEQQKH
jgi:hypothetical protein